MRRGSEGAVEERFAKQKHPSLRPMRVRLPTVKAGVKRNCGVAKEIHSCLVLYTILSTILFSNVGDECLFFDVAVLQKMKLMGPLAQSLTQISTFFPTNSLFLFQH